MQSLQVISEVRGQLKRLSRWFGFKTIPATPLAGSSTPVKDSFRQSLVVLEQTLPFPEVLVVETTNYCNLKCPMCARTTSMTRKLEHMSESLFRRIVDEAAHYEIKKVWLHQFGEPLMHPRQIEFIHYIKSKPSIHDVGMSSNVTLLNEKNAEAVLRSGLDRIILAIDAFSASTYERTRGGNFEKSQRQVRDFLEMKKRLRAHTLVQISMIEMSLTEAEVEDFKKEWAPYLGEGDEVIIKGYTDFAGQTGDYSPSRAPLPGKALRVPCGSLWNSLTIQSNGDVVACCYDVNGQMPYGNVLRESLASIWKGQEIARLRRLHMGEEFSTLPLCDNCEQTKMVPVFGRPNNYN